jgi:hypothetical protein
MPPGSILLTTGGIVIAALLALALLALLAPVLVRAAEELRLVVHDLVHESALEPLARHGTALDEHRRRTVAALQPSDEHGPIWFGRIALFTVGVAVAWIASIYIEIDMMHSRFLALYGLSDKAATTSHYAWTVGAWHAVALIIFGAILAEARGIGGSCGLFPTRCERRWWQKIAWVGILLVACTGIVFSIVTVEAIHGIADLGKEYLQWGLYMLTAIAALLLGGFVLLHLLGVLWLALVLLVRVVLALLHWLLTTAHRILDGLLRVVVALLAGPVALRGWMTRRRNRCEDTPTPAPEPPPARIHTLTPVQITAMPTLPPDAAPKTPVHMLTGPSPNGHRGTGC